MLVAIIISALITSVSAQNLCAVVADTPKCAIQFNGNYINCYCVLDPITNTVSRHTAINQSPDDLNLCSNSDHNTFCCPFNFLDRSNTFVYNGYVYDKMCNNLGAYISPPPTQLSTTNIEAFVTLLVIPSTSTSTLESSLLIPTTTQITTVVSAQLVPTVTTIVSTQLVPTITTIVSTQLVPTVTTVVVPTITTFTETIYPTPTLVAADFIPLPTSTVTVTKTVVKTKTVIRTRIYKTTIN